VKTANSFYSTGTFLQIGMQISGTIRLTGMQLSGHLMPEILHFRFGFQHSIQMNWICN